MFYIIFPFCYDKYMLLCYKHIVVLNIYYVVSVYY